MDIIIFIVAVIAANINEMTDAARYGLMDAAPLLFEILDLFFHVYEDGSIK